MASGGKGEAAETGDPVKVAEQARRCPSLAHKPRLPAPLVLLPHALRGAPPHGAGWLLSLCSCICIPFRASWKKGEAGFC